MHMPTISHSSMETWQACPFRWKLEYLDDVPATPQSALVLGRAFHRVIETDNRARIDGEPPMSLQVLLDNGRLALQTEWLACDPDRLLARLIPDMETRLLAMLSAYSQQVQHRYTPLSVEEWFRFALPIPDVSGTSQENGHAQDGWAFTGRMDAIVQDEEGHRLIVDYKSGKTAWDTGEEHTLPQATAYLWASQMQHQDIEHVLFIPIITHRSSLGYTATADFRVTTRSRQEIFSYIQRVLRTVQAIVTAQSTATFPANPGRQCFWCSVAPHCPHRA
jgi:hypothetical protein